jgi:tetratricopeptide (TPR) repeat protein
VRCLVFAATLLAALPAEAKPPPRQASPPRESERADFWRELLEPHGDEVHVIVQKATQALQSADTGLYGDYDPTGQERARFYREVLGMVRYAHRLAPDNVDVLRLLGQCADELGKTREALDALEAAVRLVGADKAGIEVTGRLGAIYLRLGRGDDALRYLRAAQAPIVNGRPITAATLVHLSNALATRGQTGDAVDVLANAMPVNPPYYSNEMVLIAFALAVQYDRDEQRGAAFEVLDHMQNQLTTSFGATVQNGLATMRFAPAEDQHYYLGLLYEVMGNYTEARAEWMLYAASGDLPYRARALDHVAAIDTERRAPGSSLQVRRRVHRRPIP